MMKIPLIACVVAIATLSSAAALTGDDIAAASLPGKTFVFTITSSDESPVRTGVWKGTFENAPGTEFNITNVSGNMPERSTSYLATSVDASLPTTSIQLPKVFTPLNDFIQLSLIVTGNTGTYSLTTVEAPAFSRSYTQTGTFVLEGAATAPEISVKQGATNLTDGSASKISFGSIKLGKSSPSKSFTITNSGDADLTGLAITKDGKNQADFVIGKLQKKSLTKGTDTLFKVTFKPGSKGPKNAVLHIKSNDSDENTFDIKLTGTGLK